MSESLVQDKVISRTAYKEGILRLEKLQAHFLFKLKIILNMALIESCLVQNALSIL